MKALLKFSASVVVTLLVFAAFSAYVFSTTIEFGTGCSLPVVCL